MKHGFAALGGLAAGSIPLVLVNLWTLHAKGYLISLRDALKGDLPALDWSGILGFSQLYLELGNGRLIRGFILGDSARWRDGLELPLVGLILILILVFLFLTVAVWTSTFVKLEPQSCPISASASASF